MVAIANRVTTLFDFSERGQGLKKIKADVAAVDGSINKAKTGIKGLWAEFSGNRAAQAAVAGLAIKIGKDAVEAASNLEESLNAVNVTYGDQADEVRALGETSAESFGLSQRAFNEFAVQFSSFAQQVAQRDGRAVSDVVQDMTGRVADFASVMNLDVSEAARVFQSALAGETEPIKKFGIDMSAAAVEAYALSNGLADSKKEITESVKVQARYGLLMQSTAKTAGDFKATQNGLANSTRTLQAQFEDLQAELGKQLLPVVADTVAEMVDLASTIDKVITQIEAGGQRIPGPIKSIAGAARELSLPVMMIQKPLDALSWGLDKVGVSSEKSAFSVEAATKSYWQQKYATENLATATTDAAIEIEESMSGAADIIASQIKGAEDEFDRYGSSIEKWRSDNEEAASEAAKAHEEFKGRVDSAMSGATSSVFSFTDDTLRDVDAWQQSMLEKAWRLGEWQNSLIEIAESTSTDFALHLADMGEAGMDLVVDLANDKDELQQSFDIWVGVAEVAGRDMAAALSAAGEAAGRALGDGVRRSDWYVRDAIAGLGAGASPTIGGRGIGRRASGGPVSAGQTYLVGEQGPELLHMGSQGGNITPNNKLGGGSSPTYNINVTAGMGADGAAVGRQVVEAIKAFERVNGARWRS